MDLKELKLLINKIGKDLIVEHQIGKVVFFCGAGVSKQGANIPLFQSLLECVLKNTDLIDYYDRDLYLKNEENLKEEWKNRIDFIFEKLCTKYGREKIDNEIKNIIHKYPKSSNYHQSILNLSKNNNSYMIITTNFDLLFNDNNKSIDTYKSYNMPDIFDFEKDPKIIYLHNTVSCKNIIYSESDLIQNYIVKNRNREFLLRLFEKYTIIFFRIFTTRFIS